MASHLFSALFLAWVPSPPPTQTPTTVRWELSLYPLISDLAVGLKGHDQTSSPDEAVIHLLRSFLVPK